jgi:hypothetical protein
MSTAGMNGRAARGRGQDRRCLHHMQLPAAVGAHGDIDLEYPFRKSHPGRRQIRQIVMVDGALFEYAGNDGVGVITRWTVRLQGTFADRW